MAGPQVAFVGLGANLDDPAAAVKAALQRLAALPQTRLEAHSSLYRSAPVGAGGPDYVNAVAKLSTSLAPVALLQALQTLEQEAGRQRPYPNAPRTLDLDLLIYGDVKMDIPELTIPHPRMHQRAFVLLPLAEIAPERVDAPQLAALASQFIARL